VSNKADAYGLVRARNHGIPTEVVDHKAFEGREAFDAKLVEVIRASGPSSSAWPASCGW